MKSYNLALEQLVVARDGASMLPAISQRLTSGDVLIVRGRNGAGKSSLLKTIAGLVQPASGQILWNDEPMGVSRSYPRNLVFLGHKRGVDLSLSVYHHVAWWAKAYGQQELIGAALHYFDLEDIANVPVHTLSAGWQQRVALTRLITQPGPLWLLDEPAANLDQEGAMLLNSLMETRCERGGIIIMATHGAVEGGKVQTLDLDEIIPPAGEMVA